MPLPMIDRNGFVASLLLSWARAVPQVTLLRPRMPSLHSSDVSSSVSPRLGSRSSTSRSSSAHSNGWFSSGSSESSLILTTNENAKSAQSAPAGILKAKCYTTDDFIVH